MLLDARKVEEVSEWTHSKVVIIGAGTIGLFLAAKLAKAKIPVVLVEAGGRISDTSRNGQTAVVLGRPHNGVLLGRAFGLGGTSVLWGGQLAEFDPSDLGIDGAHWPLSYLELQRWYDHVYEFFAIHNRLSIEDYRQKFGSETESYENIERYFTHWLPKPNFAALFHHDIVFNPFIKIILNATVNEMTFEGSTAKTIKAIVSGRKNIAISADSFIFSSGTIEISRFFLSTQRLSDVPWKSNQNIGEKFQDHLGGKVAEVKLVNEERFRNYFENGYSAGLKLQPKLRFSKDLREKSPTGVCGFFSFASNIGDNINHIKLLVRTFKAGVIFSEFKSLRADISALGWALIPLMVRYIRDRRVLAFFDRALEFHVQAEQLPIASSRIRLLDEMQGPDGLFRAALDWRVDGRELETISNFVQHADHYLKGKGIARLKIDEKLMHGNREFLAKLSDTYHQSGGMCMANSAGAGVVDSDCRVWGTKNVFISGASVFPTSSHSNCTFTALALAARLATNIKGLCQ